MIKNNIVLVLGAGASKPYGFPTAIHMKSEIAEDLINQGMVHQEVTEYLASKNEPKVSNLDVKSFWSNKVTEIGFDIRSSKEKSIDAFIEKRPQDILIGKALTAAYLIKFEKPQILTDIFVAEVNEKKYVSNWYEKFFDLIGNKLNDYLHVKLTIITFNFDRSIEYSLYFFLKNKFGATDEDIRRVFRNINIIHFHGGLGLPKFLAPKHPLARDYNSIVTPESIEAAVKFIKFIGEDLHIPNNIVLVTRDFIKSANTLIFLGFGYHEINIFRLLDEHSFSKKVHIYGTIFGINAEEVARIRKSLNIATKENSRADINLVNLTNKEFLANFSDVLNEEIAINKSRISPFTVG